MHSRLLALACAVGLFGCSGLFPDLGGDDGDVGEEPYPSSPYDNRAPADPTTLESPDDAGDAGVAPEAAAGDGDASASPPPVVYPPIDASVGAPDTASCADDATNVGYLISSTGVLSRFDAPTFTATVLGTPVCPVEAGSSPYEMAATRAGTLYVLFSDGNIYAIDPRTLGCKATPWVSGQQDLYADVAIAVQRTNGDESLSVLGITETGPNRLRVSLGRADFATMTLSLVGTMPVSAPEGDELQGDVYNRLFGISPTGLVTRIDPTNAAVLGVDAIPGFVSALHENLTAMVMGQNVFAFVTRDNDATIFRYDLVSKLTTAGVLIRGDIAAATAVPCTP